MEANPEAFKQMQEDAQRAGSAASQSRKDEPAEETKEPAAADGGDEGEANEEDLKSQLEEQVKAKREAIDKQQAFIEFK